MASFELIHPMIRAVIPASIPKLTMTDAIREAARTFCVRTVLAKENITVTTVIDEDTYPLIFDSDIVSNFIVLEANVNEKPYTGSYYCPTIQSVNIYPKPNEVEDIVFTVAVKPSLSSTSLDYGIIEEYAETLRDGALSILYSQAGSEWFEPNAANLYKARFESSINDIIVRRSDGFTGGYETATGGFW